HVSHSSVEPFLTLLASLLLAGLLALPIGLYGADLLMKTFLDNVGDIFTTTLDIRTVGIAVGLTMLVGVLIALLYRVEQFLRSFWLRRNRTFTFFRYARGVSVLQGGLALTVTVCAGLMVGSLLNLYDANLGYQPENLFTVRVVLPLSQYPSRNDQASYFYRAMETVEKLPGVEMVSGSEAIPLRSSRFAIPFTILDRTSKQVNEKTWAEFCRVGIDYHQIMGIPLLAGRYFNEEDGGRKEQVIVINRAMAEKFWPGENPVGKKVWLNHHPEERTIVGVVENVFYHGPREAPLPRIYRCYWQFPANALTLVIQTTGEVDQVKFAESINQKLKQTGSGALVGNVLSNADIRSEWVARLYDLVVVVCITGFLGILIAFFTFRRLMADSLWDEREGRGFLLPKFKETLWSFFGLVAVGFIGTILAMQTLDEFLFHASSLFPLIYSFCALCTLLLFWFGGIFPARRIALRVKEK
ncbi:MAG: ABC transporter permease, partial [Candidatus Kapaibacterium sp.]